MDNYKTALEHLLQKYSELEQYSKTFIVPLPADWPGWYYAKKLIATGWKPNVSIIPELGPFHVCLHANKDVLNFKFFPKIIFKCLWRNPGRKTKAILNICVIASLVGWQLIREKDLKTLQSANNMNF